MTDYDIRSEQSILGAIMLSGGRALEDLDDFNPADYFRPQHEELHRALQEKAKRGEPIDDVAVGVACAGIRGLDMTYALDLSQACTSWASASYHAGTVSRFATIRKAREIGQRLAQIDPALAGSADGMDAALDDAKHDVAQLGASRHSNVTMFADIADQAIDSIGNQKYTPTPWDGLNHWIRGWAPSQMYGIGARPGVGKTVFAVQAAIDAAEKGLGVAYYTFEMSGPRLYQRALASIAKVDIGKILTGNLSEAEWRAISRADHEVLRHLPIVVEGAAGWSAQRVVSHAKAAHRKHPLGLIFIDHIGRVSPGEGRRDNRQQEVADSANWFLDMAHQLDSAVAICTQLNREVTKRADSRPVATDVRESDVIEQNLDVLMLLHRDKEKTPHEMDVLVAKNRDGEEAPARLSFEGKYSRITDREWTPSGALRSA
jgi:replicative DNA helicase